MTHTARTTAALRRGLPLSAIAAAATFLAACGQSPMVLDTSSTSESVDSEPTATDVYPTGESSATEKSTSTETPSASPTPESLAEDPYLAPNAFIPQPGEDTSSEPTRVVPEGRVTDQPQIPGLSGSENTTSDPTAPGTTQPEQGDTSEPKPPTDAEKKDPAGETDKPGETGETKPGAETQPGANQKDPERITAQALENELKVDKKPTPAGPTDPTDTAPAGSSEPKPAQEPPVPAPAPEPQPAPKRLPGSSSLPSSSSWSGFGR